MLKRRAALRVDKPAFADANASPCGALLATGQIHPGQMVPISPERSRQRAPPDPDNIDAWT
jgi:hypothetical protein